MKLMYITNCVPIAKIAEGAGVDRIFVDLEYIGKDLRQGGMDTVQNHHTVSDVRQLRQAICQSELLVRVNPIHEETSRYSSTEQEISDVIDAGADIIMLPYFKTASEVHRFIQAVGGRAKTLLLFETPEAMENIDEILALRGIDEVFIGLNDLSLGKGQSFMFEPLADGTVEQAVQKFKAKGLPFGFGGIASIGHGTLPSEKIIAEHYRLGSSCVILSRSFCNIDAVKNTDNIAAIFQNGIRQILEYEAFCKEQKADFFTRNQKEVKRLVDKICREKELL